MGLFNTSTLTKILQLQRPVSPDKPVKEAFDPRTLGPKKVDIAWEAPERPDSKATGKKLNRTLLIVGVVIGMFLIVMQEFVLILLVASMIFVSYALSQTPPRIIKIEISNHGILYAGTMFYWHQLHQFFYSKDDHLLSVDTFEAFPGRLFLVFHSKDKSEITKVLEAHIVKVEEEPKSAFDKTIASIASKFNLDK